jgi:hypothetical protein
MKISLKVQNSRKTLAICDGDDEVTLVYEPEYMPGDELVINSDTAKVYLLVHLDDSTVPFVAYLAEKEFTFAIPFEEKHQCYSPRAFAGTNHILYVRQATDSEINMRKNLAFNPLDNHHNTTLFPHASANIETRGESVFAARNAVDGYKASNGHGTWPFHSWGINRDPEAELKVDFGRNVLVDEVTLYLRTDFPHDAWWEKANLDFSDGTSLSIDLIKSEKGQSILFEAKNVTWVKLNQLIKADDPSPFPALTQIEIYGTEL